MTSWDGIVLDLDDTLYETTRHLLPHADRRAVGAMREAGLALDEGEALRRLAALRASGSSNPLRDLPRLAGAPDACGDAAERAFFEYEPPEMALEDDVAAALHDLARLAPLVLMTAGHPATQRRKVERLQCEERFAECLYVGTLAGAKASAVGDLLLRRAWSPARTVVCGDRPDGDVRAANRNGCRAVLVRRPGLEFSAVAAACADDVPWRTIAHVRELPALLRGT